MAISIFAKPYFISNDGRLMRGTSMIRGEQIAKQVGAKLNPQSGYQDDVCIYVKPYTQPPYDFQFEGRPYLDVIDTYKFIEVAKAHPEVTVIACSVADQGTLSKVIDNPVILIPQHHCNFERLKRDRDKVVTVGAISNPSAITYLPDNLPKRLSEVGLNFLAYSDFKERTDVVDFYKKIDIQIIWRPWKAELSNPLKMINAATFGIPSVAYDEDGFKEMAGCYVPVQTADELIARIENLTSSPETYSDYAEKCFEKAEEYHIENIGRLYKDL